MSKEEREKSIMAEIEERSRYAAYNWTWKEIDFVGKHPYIEFVVKYPGKKDKKMLIDANYIGAHGEDCGNKILGTWRDIDIYEEEEKEIKGIENDR